MSRNRVLAVLGVVVVLAAIVVSAGGKLPWTGRSASDDSCDIPDRAPASTLASAPGGIKVVEQGFSQSPSGLVSLGAILENTSTEVARRIPVRFRLFDAAHHELPGLTTGELSVEVPLLLPGQRIGAGTGAYRREIPVAGAETTVGPNAWVPRAAVGSLGPVGATYLRTLRFYPDNPVSVDVHYRETSTNCRALTSRDTAVVFRDRTGRRTGDLGRPVRRRSRRRR
ncbi:hypothetical protein [Amycolatopsis sp. WQ 127309]|uniref:hypothetical protein n=1 Tax=Amycolatopsis sp. WQ 127309 TaxID=2932773 RepID=UPI001FF37EFC|nr:hypothetical protein [Amycolatopsis sp. WQ 127309]UOZ02578.1 hypothetical protein MUY22_27310 [Amycolatopsis sp. WQ 127309]